MTFQANSKGLNNNISYLSNLFIFILLLVGSLIYWQKKKKTLKVTKHVQGCKLSNMLEFQHCALCSSALGSFCHADIVFGYFLVFLDFLLRVHSLLFPCQRMILLLLHWVWWLRWYLDVRNKSSADPQSLVLRDTLLPCLLVEWAGL